MRTGDIASDRQAQAGAAFILVARIIETQEWFEHILAHLRRDARSVIVHSHLSQRWSRWPVIATVEAKREALPTRLARQRLKAAGRTVTSGWPWKFTLARWPCRSLSSLNSSNKPAMSVGPGCSPISPRAKAR